jgi:O-antigen/teichoic acid export membrane protein
MLIRHSIVYLSARAIPAGIEVLAIALYTRLLMPDAYGQYAIVIATVLFADMLFFTWIRFSVVRFLPKYAEKEHVLLSIFFSVFLILVVCVGIVGLSLYLFWPNPLHHNLIILGTILLWVKAWFEFHLEVIRARLKPGRYSVQLFIRAILSISLGGTFAYLQYGAEGILFGMIIANTIAFIIYGLKEWSGVRLQFSREIPTRIFLKFGLPLTASLAIGFVVNTMDRFMLAWLVNLDAAGIYAAGYDIPSKSIAIIMSVVSLASTPIIVRELELNGIKAAQKTLRQNFILLLGISIPAAIGLMLLSKNIVFLILGDAYRLQALSFIPWIAFGILIGGFKSHYVDQSFQLGKRTIIQVWIALSAALLKFVLNLWWIPVYSILGAAYATVITYIFVAAFGWIISRQVFPLPFPAVELGKIILATIGMTLCILPTLHLDGSGYLALQIIIGVVSYFMCSVLLNVGHSRRLILQTLQKWQHNDRKIK